MDISKLTHGAKLVLGGTILFLIVSFFSWFSYAGNGIWNMWHGIGVLAGLLAIVLLAWEAVHLYGIKVGLPLHPAMTGAVLAILVAIFAFIRFISTPGGDLGSAAGVGRTFWAWLGLALAIAIVVGAVANMKAVGLTMGDVKEQAAAAAASASAAAKSATDKSSDDAPAAPAPPEAAAAPATPAAPEPLLHPKPLQHRARRRPSRRRLPPPLRPRPSRSTPMRPTTSRLRHPPELGWVPAPANAGAGAPLH